MRTHRPAVMAPSAAVATGHPLATAAALRVLFDGGNAADAAIAAAGVLAVVLPDMCGLGGDAFALVFDPRDRRVTALNGSGRSASNLGNLVGARPADHTGAHLATVPGAVHAWADLLDRFGTRSRQALLAPAVTYAGRGFPIGPRLAAQIERYRSVLERDAAASSVFLPGGGVPRRGTILRQPDLAATLERIADAGPEAFYTGEIAEQVVESCRQQGAALSMDDFARHRSVWAEPVAGTYRKLELYVSPPVSQALLVPIQSSILAEDDLIALGHNSPGAVHLMVEAKKNAFDLRDRYLGDPDLAPPFPFELLSSEEGRRRRATISDVASPTVDQRPPAAHQGNTTYLAVVDRDGMAVSFIQSIFNDWGCGAMAAGTGVLLNDRLLGFSWDPHSPNVIAPGKRPVHTLSPCLALEDGALRLVIGTPGADAQVQTLMQLLVNIVDHRMDVQAAIEAPRWRSGPAGELLLERRFADVTADALAMRGHQIRWGDEWDSRTGGAQAILVDPTTGALQAGADPRREGMAAGY